MFNLKVIPFSTFEVIIVEGASTSSVLMVAWVITKRFYIVTFYKKPHLLIKYVIKSIKNHLMFPPIRHTSVVCCRPEHLLGVPLPSIIQ